MKKKLYVTKCLSMICALVCTFSVLCGSAVAKEPGIELLYTGVTVLYADINISSNGRAACTGVAMGKAGYDVELTLELMEKPSKNGVTMERVKLKLQKHTLLHQDTIIRQLFLQL